MENTVDKHAIVAFVARLLQISGQNHALMKERADLDMAIASNNARISDCEAGLRALGYNVSQQEVWNELYNSYIGEVQKYLTPPQGDSEEISALPRQLADTRIASPPSSIANLLLERLEEIGAKGSKALPLRDWLRNTHNLETHYKTVGMSLYRLSQDSPPKVHRKGHIWFFGPPPMEQPKDPGAGAPGQLDILS